MWEIWANYLLPKALKSCPKCKTLSNLVTLTVAQKVCFEIIAPIGIREIVPRHYLQISHPISVLPAKGQVGWDATTWHRHRWGSFRSGDLI